MLVVLARPHEAEQQEGVRRGEAHPGHEREADGVAELVPVRDVGQARRHDLAKR